MANCWLAKSPFQTGLIFILIVAVPFLICMVTTYLLFGVMYHQSGSCASFCMNMDRNITITSALKKRSLLEDPSDCELNEFKVLNPSIGALLEKLYSDDVEQKILKCTVAIISNNWALTSERCTDASDEKDLSIRIASNYWSRDGGVVSVTKIILSIPDLVLLNFQKSACVKPTKIAKEISVGDTIYVFKWIVKLSFPLANRYKYNTLDMYDFDLQKKVYCHSKFNQREHISCYVVHRKYCHHDLKDAPILDINNNLVGILLELTCDVGKDYGVISYIDICDSNIFLPK